MTVLTGNVGSTPYLPSKVVDVPRDVIRTFQHSKKVGNYLLGRTLGEGSFAKVKEALHIPTGEKVAVKVIDKRKAKVDSYVRKNLRREAKLLQHIRHPNVVQLYEVMETENSYYLVTELCKGGDLMDLICQRKKLDEREVKRFIRQIISAIDYLHRLGIVHRDLKVENLLLDENKDLKLIDFGLGNNIRVTDTKDGVRAQELLITQCGSPAYAAPELLGRKKYGPQVDVWSIGVNMYAMLTGALPFTVDPFNIKILYNKMVSGQMNPLPDHISRECRDLIKKFLVPEPEKRITLAEAMKHPWIAECKTKPMEQFPCPNKTRNDELVENILKFMSEVQGFRMSEVIRSVTSNTPCAALAMYQILHRKLQSHMADLRVKGKIPALEAQILDQARHHPTHYSKWSAYRQKILAFTPTLIHKGVHLETFTSAAIRNKVTPNNARIENDVTITDMDDNTTHGHLKDKLNQKCPIIPGSCSDSHKNASIQPKPILSHRRQSLPKSTVGTNDTSQTIQKRHQNSQSHTQKFPIKSKEETCEHSVNNKYHTVQKSPKSPRKIRPPPPKSRFTTHEKGKTTVITEITETSPSQKPKFQKVTSQMKKCDSTALVLELYRGQSEDKIVSHKRLIDLAFSPKQRSYQQRTLSVGSATGEFENLQNKTLDNDSVSKCPSKQKPIEAFSDVAELERITPLSCSSKNPSSRSTSKSEKSLARDTSVTLPCISPVSQTRNC